MGDNIEGTTLELTQATLHKLKITPTKQNFNLKYTSKLDSSAQSNPLIGWEK